MASSTTRSARGLTDGCGYSLRTFGSTPTTRTERVGQDLFEVNGRSAEEHNEPTWTRDVVRDPS